MAETILNKWITNKDGTKVAPYTLVDDVYMSNGGSKLSTDYQNLKNRLTNVNNTTDGSKNVNSAQYIRDISDGRSLSVQYSGNCQAPSYIAGWQNNKIVCSDASQTKSLLNLGNVENKSSATIRGELTKSNVTTALGYEPATPQEMGRLDNILYSQGKIINGLVPMNLLVNGDFQCWQRGKHLIVGNNLYGPDMWRILNSTTSGDPSIEVEQVKNGLHFIGCKNNAQTVFIYQMVDDSFAGDSIYFNYSINGIVHTRKMVLEDSKPKIGVTLNKGDILNYIEFLPNDAITDIPHIREPYGIALTRCKDYIQAWSCKEFFWTGAVLHNALDHFEYNIPGAHFKTTPIVQYHIASGHGPVVGGTGISVTSMQLITGYKYESNLTNILLDLKLSKKMTSADLTKMFTIWPGNYITEYDYVAVTCEPV